MFLLPLWLRILSLNSRYIWLLEIVCPKLHYIYKKKKLTTKNLVMIVVCFGRLLTIIERMILSFTINLVIFKAHQRVLLVLASFFWYLNACMHPKKWCLQNFHYLPVFVDLMINYLYCNNQHIIVRIMHSLKVLISKDY